MRIVSVRFKNLNSLRGEFNVAFDQSPIADSGLFAITGPTGAGKTTLLDAITVALYNKVPRHGTAVEELMTRHTGECWSEVEFETNGKRYRSKWSLNRARSKADGRFQSDKMELSVAESGEILGGHKKTETLSLIEKITGLDYEQFLRSVMLAQGEFSRFLKANAKERSELLEQMTDTFIFSRISQFIFEKTREEKKKLDDFDLILGQFYSLSPEEVEAKVKEKEDAGKTLGELKRKEEILRSTAAWFEQKQSLEKEQERLAALKALWQNDYEAFKPELIKLELHRKAKPYAHILRQMEQAQNEKGIELSNKVDFEQALSNLVLKENESFASKEAAGLDLKNAEEEKINRLPQIDEAIRLNESLLQKKKEIDQTEGRKNINENRQHTLNLELDTTKNHIQNTETALAEVQLWLTQHEARKDMDAGEPVLVEAMTKFKGVSDTKEKLQAEWKLLEDQQESIESSVADLKQKLKNFEDEITLAEKEMVESEKNISGLLEGKSSEQFQNELQELPKRISDVREQVRLSGEYVMLQKEIEAEQEHITVLAEKIEQIKNSGKQTGELLAEAEAHLLTLNELYEKEKLLQEYGAHRHLLIDGQPCPLCGALEHPFATHEPVSVLAEKENACRLQQKKVEELKAILQLHRDDFRDKTLEKQTAEKQAEQGIQQLQKLALTFENGLTQPETTYAITETEGWNAYLQNLSGQLTALQDSWKKLVPLFAKRQQQETSLQHLKNELLAGSGKLENAFVSLENINRRKAAIQQEMDQNKTAAIHLAAEIRAIISPFGLAWDEKQTDQPAKQFRALKEEYRVHSDQAKSLNGELEKYLLKQESILAQIRQLAEDALTLANTLKNAMEESEVLAKQVKNLTGETDPVEAKKQLLEKEQQARANEKLTREHWQRISGERKEMEIRLQGLTEKISAIEKRLHLLEQELDEALTKEGFEKKESLSSAILNSQEEALLIEQEKQLDLRGKQLKALADKNASDLALHVKTQPEETDEASILTQLSSLLESLEEVNRKVGALGSELEEDHRRKQQYASKLEEQKLQQQVYLRWQNLNALIGSADGTKFRNFAQGLTLSHLTALANLHLARFSPRYALAKKTGDNLDLEITDAWQADIARPISTLSGGETFLVSLALALGLSDLASNKVQIQSLFIDEGFGTLDAETLDVAMDALENLREAGKSIGIISHVEALKERITTQIQVQRLPGGYSKIEIKG